VKLAAAASASQQQYKSNSVLRFMPRLWEIACGKNVLTHIM
jgi:hypothetical protein